MTVAEASPPRNLADAMLRGALGRCPRCGQGRLLCGYLKVAPRCEVCGQDYAELRADDGPAYVTVLLVGHLVVGPMLFFRFIWTWNPLLVVLLTCSTVLAVTLAALPRVKGAFIAALWSTRTTRSG